MLLTLAILSFNVFANKAPVITVLQGEPEILDYGAAVELPIQVSDADGDSVTLYYKFDNDAEWTKLPASQEVSIVPGSIFAALDDDVDHLLYLQASDGELDSEPVSLAAKKKRKAKAKIKKGGKKKSRKVSRKRKARKGQLRKGARRGRGKAKGKGKAKTKPTKKPGIGLPGLGPPPAPEPPAPAPEQPAPAPEQPAPAPEQPATPEPATETATAEASGASGTPEPPAEESAEEFEPEEIEGIGIPAEIESFSATAVGVSYSFDDSGVWSAPKNYPLGEYDILIPHEEFDPYLEPGEHKIAFRFEEDGQVVSEDEWDYSVNQPPALQVTSDQSLVFNSKPTGPVALPLSATDSDEDDLSLFYRFNGEGDWTHVPAGLGVNHLPAEAFADRPNGETGFVEIAGWDGYDHSDERVRIGYSMEGEDGFFGSLSPGAFAGIIAGAVAVLALAVVLIVVATRKKPESSSTGLIESE